MEDQEKTEKTGAEKTGAENSGKASQENSSIDIKSLLQSEIKINTTAQKQNTERLMSFLGIFIPSLFVLTSVAASDGSISNLIGKGYGKYFGFGIFIPIAIIGARGLYQCYLIMQQQRLLNKSDLIKQFCGNIDLYLYLLNGFTLLVTSIEIYLLCISKEKEEKVNNFKLLLFLCLVIVYVGTISLVFFNNKLEKENNNTTTVCQIISAMNNKFSYFQLASALISGYVWLSS